MADITLRDPPGRSISLHDHTWYGHILKGHPEVQPFRALVEAAIFSPLEIRFTLADADCRIYYKDVPSGVLLIAVVADVVAGFVKTTYLCRTMKGATEWP